jgi:transcriptional regulator with XRE-family HTH domain
VPKPRESSPAFRLDPDALRRAIEASGLTVAELERRAGVAENYVYRLLDGSVTPSVTHAARIAYVLRVRLDRLVAESA